MTVKRYDCIGDGGMDTCCDGDYVKYEYYQTLLDKYNALLEVTTPIRVSQEAFCKILDETDNPSPAPERLIELKRKFSEYYDK